MDVLDVCCGRIVQGEARELGGVVRLWSCRSKKNDGTLCNEESKSRVLDMLCRQQPRETRLQ